MEIRVVIGLDNIIIQIEKIWKSLLDYKVIIKWGKRIANLAVELRIIK